MDNVNSETGIAYGVIHRNSIDPEMLDRIYNNGVNLRVAPFMSQLQADIARAVEENHLNADAAEEIVEKYPSFDFDDVVAAIEDAPDICDIVTNVLCTNSNPLDDMPESEDDQYEYAAHDLNLRLSGEYIFVVSSPVIVKMNQCSPCFPNAGDLGTEGNQSVTCYALPLDWFEGDADECEYKWQVIKEIDLPKEDVIEALCTSLREYLENGGIQEYVKTTHGVEATERQDGLIHFEGDLSDLPGTIKELHYEEE